MRHLQELETLDGTQLVSQPDFISTHMMFRDLIGDMNSGLRPF